MMGAKRLFGAAVFFTPRFNASIRSNYFSVSTVSTYRVDRRSELFLEDPRGEVVTCTHKIAAFQRAEAQIIPSK